MVGTSLEEIRSSGESLALFGLGLLMVYLTLSAQYESFVLPFIILLSVPMALLGALIAQPARGLLNDVNCQIAMVMLIGLASKNGIRIVEFAEQLRDKGLSIHEAAVQAAKIRLPPILMIVCLPPWRSALGFRHWCRISQSKLRRNIRIWRRVSPVLNLFFIPVLYVIVKSILERNKPAMESTPQT